MTPPPNPPTDADRRRHERHQADGRYLEIDSIPARLVDWSLGGLGVELETTSRMPAVGASVTARILRRDGATWTELKGTVRRVQGRTAGIAFDYGVADGFPTLMDLLAHRPTGGARP